VVRSDEVHLQRRIEPFGLEEVLIGVRSGRWSPPLSGSVV
jgi:hypothetical protein